MSPFLLQKAHSDFGFNIETDCDKYEDEIHEIIEDYVEEDDEDLILY